jgi:hypothetical protein
MSVKRISIPIVGEFNIENINKALRRGERVTCGDMFLEVTSDLEEFAEELVDYEEDEEGNIIKDIKLITYAEVSSGHSENSINVLVDENFNLDDHPYDGKELKSFQDCIEDVDYDIYFNDLVRNFAEACGLGYYNNQKGYFPKAQEIRNIVTLLIQENDPHLTKKDCKEIVEECWGWNNVKDFVKKQVQFWIDL